MEVNHLGDEGPEGVRRVYGENYDRLARIKRTWIPRTCSGSTRTSPRPDPARPIRRTRPPRRTRRGR
ncbi:BBE domain-containing protein [Microbispora rosea]|uniref:BBE domain-containing protein n=1 Tax=Microbispora rosea TaxID=58117 RepID=UPI00342A3C2A